MFYSFWIDVYSVYFTSVVRANIWHKMEKEGDPEQPLELKVSTNRI